MQSKRLGDCPPPNGLNHYLPLNKTGAHSTGERFRATMALLLRFMYHFSMFVWLDISIYLYCILDIYFPVLYM